MSSGELVVVGTGIKLISQLTVEAKAHIEQADKVFYLLTGEIAAEWIRTLNPNAESLTPHYKPGKLRLQTYQAMTKKIVTAVLAGQQVCAVFYGHPGIFVLPAHEAIRQVRAAGLPATMLPGISAEDCLFADIGVDPAVSGCQTFEATDFLLYQRPFSPYSHLILWQVGVVGELHKREANGRLLPNARALQILTVYLQSQYPPDHPVVVYEAAQSPIQNPVIERLELAMLPTAPITPISTLYVPPVGRVPLNEEMASRLGIKLHDLQKMW